MELLPLKSERLESGSDLLQKLYDALNSENEQIKDKDVVVIASKALSYSESRLLAVKNEDEMRKLVKKEADDVLDEGEMVITMKNKVLIPNAGIDNSNTPEGQVVLWPEDPFGSARDVRQQLMDEHKVKELGILISDSHCQPLRSGTTGIAIGWAGFYGVKDERGKKDLFGKEMTYTQMAVADDLASAANVLMGETDASIPFVIVRNAPVEFTEKEFSEDDYFISPKECIYKSFYSDELKNNF